MAKAKNETTASQGDFDPQVAEETATGTDSGTTATREVTIAVNLELKSLSDGLKEALQEISSLQKKLKKLEDQKPEVVSTVEIDSNDPRKEILDRAAVIAGQIASGSVIEGLLQGNHATTISLSAIRVATMLERVAQKVEAYPELLTLPITKAHDMLDEMVRAENAQQA